MIKVIYCIVRKPHLTRAQFHERWLNRHGKLVLERAKTIGMVNYVQNYVIDSELGAACAASRGGPAPYDAVMEAWWESDSAAMAAMGSDQGREAMKVLHADEAEIMDFDKCNIFTVSETIWKC